MRLNFIFKLKACSANFNIVLYNGAIINRETNLPSKLYSNARCFSSKKAFPKAKVIGKTQIKESEKQRSCRTDKNTFWKEGGQGRSWEATSLEKSSSKSVFAAGTAKRALETLRRNTAMVSGMDQIQLDGTKREKTKVPERPLSVAEWRELKSTADPHHFENRIIVSLIKSEGTLDIAKSLLTFVVTETGTLSYELMMRYLTLCVLGGHDSEVFDVYDIMRATFPCLETGASSLFIKSFCRTYRWREALVVLQEIKKIFIPSTRNYGNIISAAVQHNDLTTAWALYDELIENGLSPLAETWEALFTGAQWAEKREEGEKIMPQFEHEQRLVSILHNMRNYQIYPPKTTATAIKTWFESLRDQTWEGKWTSVTPNGMCKCCGTKLESIQLTAKEYQQLKAKVMVNVIQGPDVFKKTSPQELEQFKAFVKIKPAFDVVVDGLNVAHINPDKRMLSKTLLAVVSELALQDLTVLVLGRKHMLKPSMCWDRIDMKILQQKAHFFFTDNISEDDPFLLYAALNSGNHCQFVSRDLMRDHKSCLPDEATKRLFFKWQRGHQLVVNSYLKIGRKVTFRDIPIYDTIVQTSGGSWHIPYDDSDDRGTCEVPQQWLCLTNRHV